MGNMTIKLDMSKTYDRVTWNFLKIVMHKMGLQETLVTLIMNCVCSPSLSIIINGEPKGLIHPSRGLKKWEHISPYLFLMCTKGLIAILQDAEQRS